MSDTVITHFSKLAEWGNSGMAAMRANTADLLRLIGMDNDAITKIFAAQDACFVAYRYLVHIAGTGEGVGTEQGRANTAAAFASYRTQWEYVRSATVWAILAFVDKSAATGFISAEGQRAVHERLAGDDPAATADARKAHAARCESEIGELIAIASFGPTTREDDVRKRLLGGHTAQELLNSDALLKTYLSDVGSTETMETTGAPNEGASTPEVPPKIYTSYDAFAASLPGGMTANQKREAYLREALSNAARAIKIYEQRHSETGDKADSIKAAQLKKELQLILETDSSKVPFHETSHF